MYNFRCKNRVGKGKEEVVQTLQGLNYEFNSNESDSFYHVRTNIKLFDDIGLDNTLKNMIYLI